MEIFFSEAPADYETYTFPYAVYAVPDKDEALHEVYGRGFLPYSDIRFFRPPKPIFYLARSIRVRTADFDLSSENKRIRKKTASLALDCRLLPKEKLPLQKMLPLILPYVRERIGEALFPERLAYIYDFPFFNRIAEFTSNGRAVGYVWLIENPRMRHYWFAFFDTAFWSAGLGKRMMEHMISDAKEKGIPFVYLGTCYGPKALYKVRDFKGIEFFDGNSWISDRGLLKQKCKNDGLSRPDDLKLYPDKFLG